MGMAQGYSMSFESDSGRAPMSIDQLKRECDRLRRVWSFDMTHENLEAAKDAAIALRKARKEEQARAEARVVKLQPVVSDWARRQAEAAPAKIKRGAALVDPENRAASKSTGVKHIRSTITGFSHPEPDKAEAMLTRLNLRSSDPLSNGGGTGKKTALTANDISASFAFETVRVSAVERYVGRAVTVSAIYDLAFYKHTGDMTSFRGIKAAAMSILISIAMSEGWNDSTTDDRPRGLIEACAITAIEDICSPAKFIGLSGRRMANILSLPNGHKDWQRKWKSRYEALRHCLQELDIAADEQIKRRV